jgi:hypothetical protein
VLFRSVSELAKKSQLTKSDVDEFNKKLKTHARKRFIG